MRILYILTSLGIGGAEKLVLALGRSLSARGHTVAILVLRPQLPEELPTQLDVLYLDMRKSPLSVLRAIARARRFLHEFKPDIVHSHGFHGNMAARIFHFLRCAPEPVSTIHNVYEGGWTRMLAYRITDPLSRITTAVSTAAAERFVKLKAVPSQKCTVIFNGIDIAEFSPDPARRARTREVMNSGDDFIWLAAGRIVAAKDYPNLLRAFAQICGCPQSRFWDRGTDSELWIAGESVNEDVLTSLQSLTNELGLADSVRFLGLRRDLPALLDAADAFVLASAWEGMPLAVAEAMAMQKPVVATDVGGTRELLGDSGTLVPPHDLQSLAEAMLRVMQTSLEARQAQGREARERVTDHFSIDAKATEWESLYFTLAAPTASTHQADRLP